MIKGLETFQNSHRSLEFHAHCMGEDTLIAVNKMEDSHDTMVFRDLMRQHRETMQKLLLLDEKILKYKL